MAGNLQFRAGRAASQLLDRAAVQVARGEIHRGEAARATQLRVDQADALEPFAPVDIRGQAHAGDDIAHADVGGTLPLLGMQHHCFDRRTLPRQPFLQPSERRRGPGIVVAQPLRQLRGEAFGQFPRRTHQDVRLQRRSGAAGRQEAVGQGIGIHPRRAAGRHLVRQAPQVLHQHDAQRDRHRPQFADGERLHLLVGRDEAAQQHRVEVAVGVGDEGPCNAQNAGIAREGSLRQLRQLPVVTRWQVLADFADLLLGQAIVVEQPFRCRYHTAPTLQVLRAGAVSGQQHYRIVVEAGMQRRHPDRPLADRLLRGEAARMLLQALHPEQLRPYRRCVVPWRRGRTIPEQMSEVRIQFRSPADKPCERRATLAPAAWSGQSSSSVRHRTQRVRRKGR